MNGREDSKQNDLFFLCSLIEYIGRQTKNERSVIVNALGRKGLEHYYELAEVYHCENIDKVTDEIINKYGIVMYLRLKTVFLHIGILVKYYNVLSLNLLIIRMET